jgi:hypothetical protein
VNVVLRLLTGYILSGALQHIARARVLLFCRIHVLSIHVLDILEEPKTPDEGTALQDVPKAPLRYSFFKCVQNCI